MISAEGTSAETWVSVSDECPITCEVADGEAHFRFGGAGSSALEMALTEQGLANLLRVGGEALRSMRGQ
ncbi:hypothetical protein [Saccharothrix longispora]|uniref:hypothetical protein n=1 Tax=Saccharothrix longispora TaxID=33920 RepID=UPI0028FD452C|nr:hypothetical protein [Saccharothrix longispora]MDU0288511.1 hypothetical protein [Saccharothrix longispora]